MSDFLGLIDEFFISVFNFNVFVGIVVAIVVLISEIIYMREYTKCNKKVEKAKQLGNIVTAKRVKTWNDDITGTSVDSWVYAIYIYEVNGKTYQYKYMDRQTAPITLELYYIDNPRKVFTGKEKKNAILSLLFYLLPIAVAVITINLLGGV